MARRKKSSPIGCLFILALILIGVISSIVGAIREEEQAMADRALNKTMAALADPASVAVTGNKAVGHFTDASKSTSDPTFTDRYIPDDLLAGTPEEARYILYITKGSSVKGRYGATGGVGYQRWVNIDILDRTTGTITQSKRFLGSEPPSSSRNGISRSGSDPSASAITDWIQSTLTDLNSVPVAVPERTHITVHARLVGGWSNPGCWAWSSETGEDVFDAWPGQQMGITGNWYTIELPSWVDHVIINANDGTTQTADLPIDMGKDIWILVYGPDNAQIFYTEPVV